MIENVAVIGAGAMGAPMARRLRDAGFNLTICDRSEEALDRLRGDGIACTTRAADCAGCDVVLILVATPAQVRAVLSGEEGLRAGLAGRKPVVVVMSTISPAAMRELHDDLAPQSITLLDAPVSGGDLKARDGTLSIMVGGPRESFDALQPVWETLGSAVFHCGALGAGQATKIVNNIIGICNLMISAEAYGIALDSGLDLKAILPVLDESSGRNFFSRTPEMASAAYGAWASSREGFASLQAIMRKDIALAAEICDAADGLPMLRMLKDVLAGVDDETYRRWRRVAESG